METGQSAEALRDVLTRLPGGLLTDPVIHRGDLAVRTSPDNLRTAAELLRSNEELLFDYLVDITAVDWPARVPRFDVVYHLRSLQLGHILRLQVATASNVPSLAGVWDLANWGEREVYDMFGIVFDGHPDLRRILLPAEWEDGYPLRKDFPIGGYGVWAAENVPFR